VIRLLGSAALLLVELLVSVVFLVLLALAFGGAS
jgi:hypothetical protein